MAIKPDLAEAHYRLGNALFNQGHIEAAQECYRRAIALRPRYAQAHANLAFTMNYNANASPAETYAAHRAWAALLPSPKTLHRACANDHSQQRRLRIGYVSGDFCNHAVTCFFEPLLACHNRSEFEVFCYSSLPKADQDAITARLKARAEHWRSIFGKDDKDVAARIRKDRIDILIDLGGLTKRSRVQLFALKPAPVQVAWLGYLNTTGLAAMDCRVTDAIVDPQGGRGSVQ